MRRLFKKPLKTYKYTLPGDADTLRVEALAMGALCATRDYPEMKTRVVLITEARAALTTLRDAKPDRFCNDFEGMCKIYIPYYIGGFQNTMERYQRDQARYDSDQKCIKELGAIRALWQFQHNYAEHLESIKAEHATHPEWDQL